MKPHNPFCRQPEQATPTPAPTKRSAAESLLRQGTAPFSPRERRSQARAASATKRARTTLQNLLQLA